MNETIKKMTDAVSEFETAIDILKDEAKELKSKLADAEYEADRQRGFASSAQQKAEEAREETQQKLDKFQKLIEREIDNLRPEAPEVLDRLKERILNIRQSEGTSVFSL